MQVRRAHGRAAVASALFAVAAVAGAGASAGAQAPAPSAPPPARRVVVVGDSIILGAKGPMTAAFAGRGWEVVYDAEVNRSTLAGAGVVAGHRPQLTDTLVVNLGANDAGNPTSYRRRVEQVVEAAGAVPHLFWLTIREVRPYYAPANAVLREVAARHPNMTVVDWNAASTAPGLTSRDGLHLTPTGAQAMTDTVVRQVTAAPVTTTSTTTTTSATTTTTKVPTTVASTVAASVAPAPSTSVADDAVPSLDRAGAPVQQEPAEQAGWPWGWTVAVLAAVAALGAVAFARRRWFRRSVRRARARAERIAAARENSHHHSHKT